MSWGCIMCEDWLKKQVEDATKDKEQWPEWMTTAASVDEDKLKDKKD